MRNGLSNIRLQEMCSVLTYDNSRIIICFAKLISFLFQSIRNCFTYWESVTSNEYFLIIGRIKKWKSQCGKKQTQILHFYYVDIEFNGHKFACIQNNRHF